MRSVLMLVTIAALAGSARADGDLCARGAKHHGAVIDLDVKGADLHDVMRLLTDVGNVNLVISADVSGKVTLRIKHAPWDAVACTIADANHLAMTMDGNILLVQRRGG